MKEAFDDYVDEIKNHGIKYVFFIKNRMLIRLISFYNNLEKDEQPFCIEIFRVFFVKNKKHEWLISFWYDFGVATQGIKRYIKRKKF